MNLKNIIINLYGKHELIIKKIFFLQFFVVICYFFCFLILSKDRLNFKDIFLIFHPKQFYFLIAVNYFATFNVLENFYQHHSFFYNYFSIFWLFLPLLINFISLLFFLYLFDHKINVLDFYIFLAFILSSFVDFILISLFWVSQFCSSYH